MLREGEGLGGAGPPGGGGAGAAAGAWEREGQRPPSSPRDRGGGQGSGARPDSRPDEPETLRGGSRGASAGGVLREVTAPAQLQAPLRPLAPQQPMSACSSGRLAKGLARLKLHKDKEGGGGLKERRLVVSESTNRLLQHQLEQARQAQQQAEDGQRREAQNAARERVRAGHYKREAELLKLKLDSLSDERMLELEQTVRDRDKMVATLKAEVKTLKRASREHEQGCKDLDEARTSVSGLRDEIRTLKARNRQLSNQHIQDDRLLTAKQEELVTNKEELVKARALMAGANRSLDMAEEIAKLKKESEEKARAIADAQRKLVIAEQARESQHKKFKKELRGKALELKRARETAESQTNLLELRDRALRAAQCRAKDAEREQKETQRKMKEITGKLTAQLTAVLPGGSDPDVVQLPGLSTSMLGMSAHLDYEDSDISSEHDSESPA